MIWSRWKDFDKTWLSPAEAATTARQVRTLEDVAAWSTGLVNLTGDGDRDAGRGGRAHAEHVPRARRRAARSAAGSPRPRTGPATTTSRSSATGSGSGATPAIRRSRPHHPGRTASRGPRRRRHARGLQAADRLRRRRGRADADLGAARARPEDGRRRTAATTAVRRRAARSAARPPASASAELATLTRNWTRDGLYPARDAVHGVRRRLRRGDPRRACSRPCCCWPARWRSCC